MQLAVGIVDGGGEGVRRGGVVGRIGLHVTHTEVVRRTGGPRVIGKFPQKSLPRLDRRQQSATVLQIGRVGVEH